MCSFIRGLSAGILTLLLVTVALLSACGGPVTSGSNMLIDVRVLTDKPQPGYEPLPGQPSEVGIYEFYLQQPDLPGSGSFRKIGSIALQPIGPGEYRGSGQVAKIDGTLCVGYPPLNFIDGQACVKIDQALPQVEVTVHYWKSMDAVQ